MGVIFVTLKTHIENISCVFQLAGNILCLIKINETDTFADVDLDVNVCQQEKKAFEMNRLHMFPFPSGLPASRRDVIPAV